METILIIDDEEELCRTLSKVLGVEGYDVSWSTDANAVIELIREKKPSCILLDLKLRERDGLAVLSQIMEQDPTLPVIMLTAYETVNTAVNAMKQGAFHYMAKPFDNEELKVLVQKAIEKRQLHLQIQGLKDRLGESDDLETTMGNSEKIHEVIRLVRSVAATTLSALVMGESGSGKELVAKAIHRLSKRSQGPFIPVDCAAIPEGLIESELFGHERGAFTGATSTEKGKFEIADGGTLFLDEIQNIPSGVQAKLLRFLEDHTFERVGGKRPLYPSVRVITATSLDLGPSSSSREGVFRLDLFHRLNEFPIHLPPLRERRSDIPVLCYRFLHQYREDVGKEVQGIAPGAMERLIEYDFPGNVRELRNLIKRSMVSAAGQIELVDLPPEVRSPHKRSITEVIQIPVDSTSSLKEASRQAVGQIEKSLILNALSKAEWRRGKAAEILGIDEKTLYNKMKEYAIHH